MHFQDPDSVVYRVGSLLVHYLVISEADALVSPARVAGPGAGVRMQLTIPVEDVEDVIRALREAGAEIL